MLFIFIPSQLTKLLSAKLHSRFCQHYDGFPQARDLDVLITLNYSVYNKASSYYGITGCGVFKAGIHDWKVFCIKITVVK